MFCHRGKGFQEPGLQCLSYGYREMPLIVFHIILGEEPVSTVSANASLRMPDLSCSYAHHSTSALVDHKIEEKFPFIAAAPELPISNRGSN